MPALRGLWTTHLFGAPTAVFVFQEKSIVTGFPIGSSEIKRRTTERLYASAVIALPEDTAPCSGERTISPRKGDDPVPNQVFRYSPILERSDAMAKKRKTAKKATKKSRKKRL